MSVPVQEVRVSITDERGRVAWIENVDDYELSSDMLLPADAYTLSVPFNRDVFAAAKPDNEISVFVDATRVYNGRIDGFSRTLNKPEGSKLEITGRDNMARVLDESSPVFSLAGMGIVDLGRKLAGEFFDTVVTSNAQNRRLLVGPRKKGQSAEPAIDVRGKESKRKVEPGESRWQVLQYFLEEAGLLCWSSGDGSQLVIGKPNYQQVPQWQLFAAAPGSGRRLESNIIDLRYVESIAERYSHIVVYGAVAGESDMFSSSRKKQRSSFGEAKDNPLTADGAGVSFRTRKRLYLFDNGVTRGRGTERAAREMAERNATGRRLQVTVAGHGQAARAGERPALWAFDTVARFEDEEAGIRGDWFITAVHFRGSKSAGQVTVLDLVPLGTDLRSLAGG